MDVDDKKQLIRNFLKSLKRAERLIIVLYYFEEMTIPEIAKVLELSTSKVLKMHSSIISQCKAYLREQSE
ncbi:sigma factor-like helix-turn-helix DNA-binding protein [Planctomycetota bacterium]